jgi:hypothetical protein
MGLEEGKFFVVSHIEKSIAKKQGGFNGQFEFNC